MSGKVSIESGAGRARFDLANSSLEAFMRYVIVVVLRGGERRVALPAYGARMLVS